MSTWAIIPIKDPARAKSRLSGVLPDTERELFVLSLFEHVVAAARAADCFDRIVVATDSDRLAGMALDNGLGVQRDRPGARLNQVIDECLKRAQTEGATATVVLMSDLPNLTADELVDIVAHLPETGVVLGPDDEDEGTNVLAMRPPGSWNTCFGNTGSFNMHRARLQKYEVNVEIYESPGVAFDVDTPDDYQRLSADGGVVDLGLD